jgi:Caspase domain
LHVPPGSVLGQSEAQRVSERRVALVVGNSAYRNVSSLTNPANDAALIAKTLSSLGFELVGDSAQIDLDKPAFEAIVKRFGLLLQGAEVGLFYYAGHGVQVHGENYLVPVSANPEREADVDFEMLGTTLVMRQMEGAHTRLNLILLDACRNNPFGTRTSRATSRGLAQMEAPEGTLISFATQPGNVASDGEDGDSPYTKALAQTIKRPGLGLFDVFNDVGLAVKKQTGGAQQPWVSSSPIGGSFYFSGPSVAQPVPLATAPAHAEQPNEAQQVWGTIQNTNSVAVLERFIQQFPASFYSDIARTRLDELKKSQAPAPSASRPAPYSAGAMSCAELNRPHDPQPVRQWLRGYLSSAGYDGDYQAAAADIGVLCQESPQWTLEMSARHWVEDLWGKRNGFEGH